MLKLARHAQRALATRASTPRIEVRLVSTCVQQARGLLDLHLCDFHALGTRCLDPDGDPRALEALFGLDVATLDTLKRVMLGHVARTSGPRAVCVLPPFSPPPAERRAYRALFQGVSRITTLLTVEAAHHSARVLAEVDGFRAPKGWTKEGEASVRALVALAKAGVSRLRTEECLGEDDGTKGPPLVALTWAPTSQGIDVNRHWIPTVALALLRSRAAFQVATAVR